MRVAGAVKEQERLHKHSTTARYNRKATTAAAVGVAGGFTLAAAAATGRDRRCRVLRRETSRIASCSRVTRSQRSHADAAVEPTRRRWRPSQAAVRWGTGLVLGLGVCGPATFHGGWPFAVLVSTAVFFVVHEYTHMLDYILSPPLDKSIRWFTLVISVLTVLAAQVGILTGIFECAAVALLVMLLALQGNKQAPDGGPPIRFSHISSQVFGVFYCGYLPAFWVRLRDIAVPLKTTPSAALQLICRVLGWKIELTVGAFATASCALCIIAADTCAYMGGKRWGKRPLILISPRKTWEGMFCGLLGSVCMALLCDAGWGFPAKPLVAVAVGVLIFAASLLGDLTVSAMKRDAGVKDAGALFPGHGGILDRFDSFFFSAPTAYFCWF
eukprot:CAMPEP_0178374052 /NCGR_PEP_ID=MMETSP0689_2-20121128/2180_1 /TAXON_ID=160604 /ORGANISM="Amphidinium massartii, Strain CS-259" /LENGTH=384 /DNA_ID=CAMNT_0019994015 /DNA_START=1 /DNA_END=1152 /DNA_ORIENTATION=+